MVTVLVGNDPAAKFLIHHHVAVKSSCFSKALEGHFEEATTGTIHLVDDDPAIVELYVHWLHCSNIPTKLSADDMNVTPDDDLEFLFDTYAFGDKICDNKFCNNIMDSIRYLYNNKSGKRPPACAVIRPVWDNFTQRHSLLKRLIINTHVHSGRLVDRHNFHAYHPEYLYD